MFSMIHSFILLEFLTMCECYFQCENVEVVMREMNKKLILLWQEGGSALGYSEKLSLNIQLRSVVGKMKSLQTEANKGDSSPQSSWPHSWRMRCCPLGRKELL